jgi:hypothetical protein
MSSAVMCVCILLNVTHTHPYLNNFMVSQKHPLCTWSCEFALLKYYGSRVYVRE